MADTPIPFKTRKPLSLNPISIGKTDFDKIKVIGGKGYDVRQVLPFKYPDVRERFLNARKNTWLPSEIPMLNDRVLWESDHFLTPDERFMFKCNISYLTASDNLVTDNIATAILDHITANEMRQYLRKQGEEEANHIESYLFILESFGLDEKGKGQIFELYQDSPELIRKLNWNIEFTNNLKYCEAPIGDEIAHRALLEDLISYYVFEALFFPVAFVQVFALGNQSKLVGAVNQYRYIWRDETLHAENLCWLIQQIIRENPQLWDKAMQTRAREIINEGVMLECAYGQATLPNGGIVGLSLQQYQDYARFVADGLCSSLNLPLLFNMKSHPLEWMVRYQGEVLTNFFESRPQEYRKGNNLDWDF